MQLIRKFIGTVLSPIILVAWIGTSSQAFGTEEYRRILYASPIELLPSRAEDANSLQLLVQTCEGLVTTEQGEVRPGLASGWSVDRAGLTYKFEIRPDAKFSSGRSLGASDVVSSFQASLEAGSLMWNELKMIKGAKEYHEGKANTVGGIRIDSEKEISISLEHPFPPFLSVLSAPNFCILPPKALAVLKEAKAAPFEASGPYVITSVTSDEVILEKNTHYFERDKVYFDRISYRIEPDKERATKDFLSGKYDDIWPYHAEAPKGREKEFQTIPTMSAFSWFLQFNPLRPSVRSKALRKVIAAGGDQNAFLKAMGLPAHFSGRGYIPRGMVGFRERAAPSIDDQEIAKLLSTAGCTVRKPCKIELIYSHDVDAGLAALLAPLQKLSSRLVVSPRKLSRAAWFRRITSGDFDFTYSANNAIYYDTYFMLRYLEMENYFPGLKRTKISRLLAQAQETADRSKRATLYEEVDNDLMSQAVMVPIYHGDRPSRVARADVDGYRISMLGYPHLAVKTLRRVKVR